MKDLSVVLPVFNASSWIEEKISILQRYLESLPLSTELIVVDDGSSDGTEIVLKKIPSIKSIALEKNLGKFGAIATGIKEANGACKIFTDCDLPYDLEAIGYIASIILNRKFHVVTGDRTLTNSKYTEEISSARSLASKSFSLLVRLLVTGGLFDTQCGLKGFRSDVADAIFPLMKERGFAGDVEILYIALKYNLEIKRVPVRLSNQGDSSIRLMAHSLKMLMSLFRIPYRWYRGDYYSNELKSIADQSYWKS